MASLVPEPMEKWAVEVTNGALEEQPPEPREHRIAEVAILEGHRARHQPALEAIAHHQVIAGTQPFHEELELRKVIAVVGVAHHDVLAERSSGAGVKRCAVATNGDVDDPRAEGSRHGLAAVGRAVVGDHDFPIDVGSGEKRLCLLDTGRQRLGLVEARHQNAQLQP
jgi:hypothetical protein